MSGHADQTYMILGQEYPRVSRITDLLAKPGLPGWAAKCAAEAALVTVERQPEHLFVEEQVCHTSVGYAGTLDQLIRIPRGTYVLDVKTGRTVYPSVRWQLVAYAHATQVFDRDRGLLSPMPPVDGALVLHLRPDDWDLREVDVGEAVWNGFRHLAWLWHHAQDRPSQLTEFPAPAATKEET